MERKIGFLGGGAMAEAIISGICQQVVSADNIYVFDIDKVKLNTLSTKYGIKTCSDPVELVHSVNVLLLAVKPQIFPLAISSDITSTINKNTLIVSIMGSVSIEQIKSKFPNNPIIRTMPNTPLAVKAGMTAIVPDTNVSTNDIEFVNSIFSACGEIIQASEKQIEAITAISGCGPGYVFMLIDALADAGVSAGLTREASIKLAAQTFMGAGKMVIETKEHPAVLRDKVTSPGGTTIAGIRILEKNAVRSAFVETVHGVIQRSQEILKENK